MARAFSSNTKDPHSDVVSARQCCLSLTLLVAVCVVAALMLWPSNPEVKIVRLVLKRVKVHPVPPVGAEVWISVTVRVRNWHVYWMELKEVDVGVRYRGKKLGHVESEGWHVRGLGIAHVDGELEYKGLPAAETAHLLEEMAKGRVGFRTVTEVTGQLGLLFFRSPFTFKAILSCEILVNTKSHTIDRQHCLHKD